MKRYPLLLEAVTKTALWGGSRLREQYGKCSPHAVISESWELTLRDGDENTVRNGEASGMTLTEYLSAAGIPAEGHFPLLIKLIDAADRLSVQVHPDDAYAHAHGVDSGKTEMWVVVDAEPGATLILGLKEGVSASDFRDAVDRGELASVMREVPVSRGDVFYIPAGLLHAIGAGILIAEIQQNSDTTYRVWDYDRRGADGKLRPLHVAEAKEVVRPISDGEVARERFSRPAPALPGECLASAPFFAASRTVGNASLTVGEDAFVSLLVTEGDGILTGGGETLSLRAGASVLLPRGTGRVELTGDLTCLWARP